MIICDKVRLAVTVEKKIGDDDLLEHCLLFRAEVVACQYPAGDVFPVILEPSYDGGVERLDAERAFVSVKDRREGLAGLKERSVRLDLDYKRDLAVNEFQHVREKRRGKLCIKELKFLELVIGQGGRALFDACHAF